MNSGRHIRASWILPILEIVIVMLGAMGIAGQQQPGPMPQPHESSTQHPARQENTQPPIAVEAAAVSMDVVVTDDDGRILNGLKAGNFRVLDNGRPQKITNFSPTSAPITMVMLLEYSAASYNYFAYKSAAWGAGFLDHLEQQDWIALVTYDMKPKIRVDFTRNKAEVRQSLASLSYPQFRESNLFDAMLETLDRIETIKGKKSILLLSTGANTFGGNTLDQVYNRLKQTDVTVFCVGVAEQEYQQAMPTDIGYVQAKNQLNTFAELTGGIAWFPRFEGEIPGIYKSVVSFLRSQYRLGFSPPEDFRDGKYHKLKVEIVAPDGSPLKVTDEKGKRHKVIVYVRQGYIAGKRAQTK